MSVHLVAFLLGDKSERTVDAPAELFHVADEDELDEAVRSFDVVLADFYADWCGPCKMIESVVEEYAREP